MSLTGGAVALTPSDMADTIRTQRRDQPTALAWCLIGLVALALFLLRRPAGLLRPTIWAEDGLVFLSGPLSGQQVWDPYIAQVWVAQRVLGQIVTVAPATWWPWLLYVVSAVAVVAPATVVLSRRAQWLFGPVWARGVVVLGIVLLPGTWEVQGNIANLHWYWTAIGLVVLTMRPPRAAGWQVVELAVLALVATSGYSGLLLLPVAVWMQVRHRHPGTLARLSVVAASAAVGLLLAATAGRSPHSTFADAVAAGPSVVLRRVGGVWLVGEEHLDRLWAQWSPWLLVAAVALMAVLVALVVLDWRGPSPVWVGTGLLAVGLGLLATASADPWSMVAAYHGGRYFPPLLFAVVLVVARALGTGAGPRRILALVGSVLLVGGMVGDAVLEPMGPVVPSSALRAFDACARGAAPPAAGGAVCKVEISPPGGIWWLEAPPAGQ